MGQDATWHGGRPSHRPTRHCVRCGPSYPQKIGHTHPTQCLAYVYCGQTAGWMKTPLGTEVDLGPGHIVLDGGPSSRERGTAAPPLFSAHVYCGHGRPSQLPLSFVTTDVFICRFALKTVTASSELETHSAFLPWRYVSPVCV